MTIIIGIVIYIIIYRFQKFYGRYNENIDKITTHDNNFLEQVPAILELRVYSIVKTF